MREDAPPLYDGLTSGGGLAFVIGSAVAAPARSRWSGRGAWRPRAGRAAAAVACVAVGWAFAQSPDLLPGELTLDEAAAGDATLTALLISVAVGAVLLVPSLVLLYRLVLRGDLDQQFEPLDQRFRPTTADDHPVDR